MLILQNNIDNGSGYGSSLYTGTMTVMKIRASHDYDHEDYAIAKEEM